MPRRRPKFLPKYDLNTSFTTKGGHTYFLGADPTEHLQVCLRGDSADASHVINAGAASTSFAQGGTIANSEFHRPFDKRKIANVDNLPVLCYLLP